MCNKYCEAFKIIKKPEQLESTVKEPFRASKLIIDRNNELYVIADSINMGAFVFTEDYNYKSFYGSNNVTATVDVLLNFIRKKFLTRKQLSALQNYTPVSIRNIDIDSEGFLYTVTEKSSSSEIIKKLNYRGKNIIYVNNTELSFGDLEWDRQDLGSKETALIDIDVDSYGFINVIDEARNKVFQYSPEGHLLAVFGGSGEQIGLFRSPKAIESVGNEIYVLDQTDCSITKFTTTPYMVAFRNAYNTDNSADADASILNWQKVLDLNTNNKYPYYKMGLAYEVKGEYSTAMEYFKLADNRVEYSKAFREYRKTFASDNIIWIVLIALFIIIGLVFAFVKIKKKMIVPQGEAYSPLETKRGLPIYTLFHPIDGFEQLRNRKFQSVKISSLLVLLWLILKIAEYFFTGFIFNEKRAVDFSFLSILIGTVVIFALFVVSNLAFTTFLGGKRKFTEIITVTAYSLIPFLTSVFINILLSNILTTQETAFMSIIAALGLLWTAIILVLGLGTIHDYSFLKTILSIILSVLGMAVISLLILLFYTLMQQLFQFISSIVYEIKIR